MASREYRFTIDAFRPDTLPMRRLAEYLMDLARLLGSEGDVHFERLEEGSVQAVAWVENHAQAKVAKRLDAARSDEPPQELVAVMRAIDDRLAEDNAVGRVVSGEGGVVLRFLGRERPKPVAYPAFSEPAFIEGVLTSLSGSDETKHAQLMDGTTKYTGLQTKNLELLSRLKTHLWGQPVRLIGRGRFQRHPDGSWEMKSFLIDDFEPISDASLEDTVAKLRSVPDGIKVTSELLHSLWLERDEDTSS